MSGRVTHEKRLFSKTYIFFYQQFSVHFFCINIYLWYPDMSSIDLATRLKIGMCLLQRFFEINRYNTSLKWISNR